MAEPEKVVRCARCERRLTNWRHTPGAEGQPAYCHWSESQECFNAYRRWRYEHDPEYRERTLKTNREWKQEQRREREDVVPQGAE
jgi:hypothetical protein